MTDESVTDNSAGENERAWVEAVQAELEKMESQKSGILNKLIFLVLSIIIFFRVGLMNSSWESAIILIVVLLVHEGGHWLGMKFLGYKDVSMFFIPFFGAAVSGKKLGASGSHQAIVAFLGPVPGILIGVIGLIVYRINPSPLLLQYIWMSLIINTFNLLPLIPFDGGRIMDAILFSRHPLIEAIFRVIAVLAMAALAFAMSSIALGVISVFLLMTLSENYAISKMAIRYKKGLQDQLPELTEKIPPSQLGTMLPYLMEGLPQAQMNPRRLALRARALWSKLFRNPPGLWPTVGFLLFFLLMMIAGVGGMFVTSIALSVKTTVVQKSLPDGTTAFFQIKKIGRHTMSEVKLNDQGLYDGPITLWNFTGKKETEGFFTNGYRDGKWTDYDSNEQVKNVCEYENGKPIKYSVSADGELSEVPPEKWPRSFANTKLEQKKCPVFKP